MIILKQKQIIILVFFISFTTSLLIMMVNGNNNYNHTVSDFDTNIFDNTYQIGTLEIINTDFRKKLVQTTDNTFFLSHDENGNLSNLGSVFLDYRNQLTDRKLLIYGHNSKTIKEAPFHFLENYLEYDFGKKYNLLLLKTGNNLFYYQLFTVMIVTNNFQHINLNWSDASYHEHLTWLKENSIFSYDVDIMDSDPILLLQTCYYEPNHSYLLVGWKKIT